MRGGERRGYDIEGGKVYVMQKVATDLMQRIAVTTQ